MLKFLAALNLDLILLRLSLSSPSDRMSEIQPSEIEALAVRVKAVSSKTVRSVLQAQLSLIRASANTSPVEIFTKWLSQFEFSETVENIFHPVLLSLTSGND